MQLWHLWGYSDNVPQQRYQSESVLSQILLKHVGDGFDEYRDIYNEKLLDQMLRGQNGITTKMYFTATVTADTLELTQQKLAAKALYMWSCFQKIGSNIEKLKA